MSNDTIGIKCMFTRPRSLPPAYMTDGAAGADLYAAESVVIRAGRWTLVPLGIALEIPEGFEAQIRPRSSLALRHGITVLNAPGTIDSDYRGEISVILANTGPTAYRVMEGERIAQLVIAPVTRAAFLPSYELAESDRGEGGFGSTGQN